MSSRTPVAAVDFETYYDNECSVTALDVDAYCEHPDFKAYLVSIVTDDGLEYVGPPAEFDWSQIHGMHWVSHNARFDETVFEVARRRKQFRADVNPSQWSCTADMAVYLQAPRTLKGAAKQLLGKEVDKSVRVQMKGACPNTEVVRRYALEDARLCLELWGRYNSFWPLTEQAVSLYNRKWGSKGIRVDTEKLSAGIKHLSELRWRAEQEIPWDWDSGKTPLAWTSIKEQCVRDGIEIPSSFAQTSEECLKWEDKYASQYAWINALRQWRRTNMFLKKLQTMYARIRPNGVFPYSIKYFGAHTGRFSGSGGFNMQNLPRGSVFGVNFREMFVPRRGKKFVISDLAQIEARVLLHLAGDKKMIAKVNEGYSLYEAYARDKGLYAGEGKLKETDPGLYQLAKAMVLGLGYGCGKGRFQEVAKLLANVDLTPEESVKHVESYRASNPHVTQMWAELQNELRCSIDDRLELELPSGRSLTYFDVSTTTKDIVARVVRGGTKYKFYGGKLTENVVQATARDVLVESFKPLDQDGLSPVLHVHDEIVCEVDTAVPDEEACAEVNKRLGRTPDWLEGCPIEAEAQVAYCYTK